MLEPGGLPYLNGLANSSAKQCKQSYQCRNLVNDPTCKYSNPEVTNEKLTDLDFLIHFRYLKILSTMRNKAT
jgi:hypothetical protein